MKLLFTFGPHEIKHHPYPFAGIYPELRGWLVASFHKGSHAIPLPEIQQLLTTDGLPLRYELEVDLWLTKCARMGYPPDLRVVFEGGQLTMTREDWQMIREQEPESIRKCASANMDAAAGSTAQNAFADPSASGRISSNVSGRSVRPSRRLSTSPSSSTSANTDAPAHAVTEDASQREEGPTSECVNRSSGFIELLLGFATGWLLDDFLWRGGTPW